MLLMHMVHLVPVFPFSFSSFAAEFVAFQKSERRTWAGVIKRCITWYIIIPSGLHAEIFPVVGLVSSSSSFMPYKKIYIYLFICLCIVSVAVEFVQFVANCSKFSLILIIYLAFSVEAFVFVAANVVPNGQIVFYSRFHPTQIRLGSKFIFNYLCNLCSLKPCPVAEREV